MKLAEALILRADLQKRIEQLKVRLNDNAKVQENDEVAEQPTDLLNELDGCIDELKFLISRINKTNCTATIEGQNLVDLIAKRDTMSMKATILRGFLQSASQKVQMYSNTEIRVLSTVNVANLQKQVDELSRQIRQTDTLLQMANWQIDLI